MLEQGELSGLYGVFGDRTADNDKAVRGLPAVRLIPELSGFPTVLQFVETASQNPGFDRGVKLGHNRIAAALLVEKLDHPSVEKPRIGSEADAGTGDGRGNFGKADFDKRHRPGGGDRIAGA